MGVGLVEDAGDALGEIVGVVVHRRDDAHKRRAHHLRTGVPISSATAPPRMETAASRSSPSRGSHAGAPGGHPRGARLVSAWSSRALLGKRLEPRFAPPRVDGSSTEPLALIQVSLADDSVEDVAVALEIDHLSGSLVDEPLDLGLHRKGPAAIGKHFAIEPQALELAVGVECACDLGL